MDSQTRPIDTSDVELGPELVGLTELLAEQAHQVWMNQRLEDGWQYGPARDDSKKEHPCLVAYDALPESEKVYDRNASIQTLKSILALGFRIEPPKAVAKLASSTATDEPEATSSSLLDILADREATPGSLFAFWTSTHDQRISQKPAPEVFAGFARRMLESGDPLLAYDLIVEGLIAFPDDVTLRQLQGLALARGGDPLSASKILSKLVDEGHADEETLGLLARTDKDLGLKSLDHAPEQARSYLIRSFQTYDETHRKTGGTWTGINAATLALILGDEAKAKELALRVFELGLREWQAAEEAGRDAYWSMATLGEAALILGDLDESGRCYSRVASIGSESKRFGDLGSTRRQARLLARYREGARAMVDRSFRPSRVVVFSGHRIDRPDRPSPRFPIELEDAVRLAIREHLEAADIWIGYSSAASGSDLLFLEELIGRGGEARVVLPYQRDLFLKESVVNVPGDGWAERFRAVLDQSEVITASPQKLEVGGISYEFANLMAHGLASLKAKQLDAELLPMAVWDGRPGDGPGGTAGSVERWRDQGYTVDLIDLASIARSRGFEPSDASISGSVRREPAVEAASSELGTQIVPILFADVVGFSKLTEDEIPRFVRHFLGLIAQVLARLPEGSVKKKNTWGDGLYCVFEEIEVAGRFALDLRDEVVSTRWEDKGLPAGMNIRIALHAGPVYVCEDPVTERSNCLGTHVSHAARIEPITPPGQVFASQAFAALAAARRIEEFECHYVGRTPLAKGHGTYPTYHVHPTRERTPVKKLARIETPEP